MGVDFERIQEDFEKLFAVMLKEESKIEHLLQKNMDKPLISSLMNQQPNS